MENQPEFRGLDKSLRKQKIIDTAAALFHQQGFASTTLDDVSKELGISKAALIMLTQMLAQELGTENIRVNAIAPGVIKTRFSQILWQMPQFAEPILDRLPLGRFGEPEDVAELALYLASSASDYVTGSVFVLDGGMNVASTMA